MCLFQIHSLITHTHTHLVEGCSYTMDLCFSHFQPAAGHSTDLDSSSSFLSTCFLLSSPASLTLSAYCSPSDLSLRPVGITGQFELKSVYKMPDALSVWSVFWSDCAGSSLHFYLSSNACLVFNTKPSPGDVTDQLL